MLFDRIDGCTLITRIGSSNVGWLIHVAARECDDLTGHRCREEHGLSVARHQCDDPFDVGQKAHVEHLICFVENEFAHVG